MLTPEIEAALKTVAKADLSPIWVTGLPMPPTSNKQYQPFRNRRTGTLSFRATAELREYHAELDHHFYLHPTQLIGNIKKIQSWLDHGLFLEVRAVFFFDRARILTKKDLPKRLDVSNRIKSLHDGLTRVLGVDDCLFFRITAEKRVAPRGEGESVVLEITPYWIEQ